ncbi:hypothetical protein TgHK011_000728 [Trichoderma gracile]|nr:hypothetical protein TgHK011_000728 [Trichoderma gracile]
MVTQNNNIAAARLDLMLFQGRRSMQMAAIGPINVVRFLAWRFSKRASAASAAGWFAIFLRLPYEYMERGRGDKAEK